MTSRPSSQFAPWLETAERILGFCLDGDEDKDGHSIEGAYEAFRRNESPDEYAQMVIAIRAGLNRRAA